MVTYHQQIEADNQLRKNLSTNSIIELKNHKNISRIQKFNFNFYLLSIKFYTFFILSQLSDWLIKNFYFSIKYFWKNNANEIFKSSLNRTSCSISLRIFVLACFLFSMESISANKQNSTSSNKTFNCEKTLRKKVFYDENLFQELKMNQTLINLYRSCYKDMFHEYKSSHFFVPKPGQRECFIDQIEPNHILYELIFNRDKNFIPQKVLDRIDLVCANNQLNDLDRAFFLIGYKHSICGNIFKNSVKNTHLKDYIFRETGKRKRSNKVHSVSSRHHHNKHYDIAHVKSLKSYSISNNSDQTNTNQANEIKFSSLDASNVHLNNCSLILLNIYLLSHTASCSYDDFVESLNHFDCLSNYFSVKSNCEKCQDAYKKWLCSSMIPYYDRNDELVKPCQRYCYTVENMCPFFRPTDSYGGQPVFHCRNVVQVIESKPDGYEDDDENYIDEDKFDDDRCYAECNAEKNNQTQIDVDLNLVIKEKMSSLVYSNSNFIQNLSIDSMFDIWIKLKSNQNSQINQLNPSIIDFELNFNSKGRFNNVDECLFGLQPVISSSGLVFKYNTVINFVSLFSYIFFIS